MIICGLRYDTGPDYMSYNILFNQISKDKLWFVLEPGFSALNIFFGNYGSFRLMLLCIAVFSIFYKLNFIYKESYAPFLSILIYYSSIFLGSDFGQVRQGISLCFALMAFQAAYDKTPVRFILFVLLAGCFHYSAIIIIPFYYLSRIHFTEKRVLWLYFFCFVAAVTFTFFSRIIVTVLDVPYLTEKFILYKDESSNIVIILLSSIVKLTIIIYYFKEKSILLKEKKQVFFFNLYIWGYGISILFMQISAFAQRGTLYFEILELILLPNIIKSIKPNENIIYCMCIIAYTGLCIYKNIVPYPELFIPYNISLDLSKSISK
jgi:hypothetical protein